MLRYQGVPGVPGTDPWSLEAGEPRTWARRRSSWQLERGNGDA